MLVSSTMMPAMASPLTNFMAPSIEPKNCDSRESMRPAPPRLVVVDVAGAQLGVDRHLLAGHGVQREAGAHLGHPLGALRDDDELDDREDEEDDGADDQVARDHEVAEGVDEVAGVGLAPG